MTPEENIAALRRDGAAFAAAARGASIATSRPAPSGPSRIC
ncbi:MAG: hypothetical protein ACXVQ7_00840 [Actinomycetota bacterium]